MSKLLVIDSETSGLDPLKHNILSLGAVVWEDGVLGNEFEIYILEPELQIDNKAMEVNRISLQWLYQNGVGPVEAVKHFMGFVASNCDFSRAFPSLRG